MSISKEMHQPKTTLPVIEYPSAANGSVVWYLQVGNDTLIVVNNHLESTHLTKEDRSQYHQLIKGDMESDTARASSRHLLSVFSESSVKRAPQAEFIGMWRNIVARISSFAVILTIIRYPIPVMS